MAKAVADAKPDAAISNSAPDRPRLHSTLLGWLALAAAAAFAVALATRPINSPDIGYHLAYGEQFWATGRPVDYNPYIYTLPAADATASQRPSAGPGCWYDSDGRYRFANANWLSQVIMSPVNKWASVAGLCGLQIAMVAGIFALCILIMRHWRVPPAWIAPGVVLIAITAYERFTLRPELFSYLILTAQLYLLTTWRSSRWRIAALVVLQLLLVNVHSYFLLGLALTGAFFADGALRMLWNRLAHRPQAPGETRPGTKVLGIVLACQALMSFVNPWTWRLAALPFQTLVFLRQNQISGGEAGSHPWSQIGEFFSPFATFFTANPVPATTGYEVLLYAVVPLGVLACLLLRRWSWALVIAGMMFVSLGMRRNIAPAAMLIVPLAMAALYGCLELLGRRMPALLRAFTPRSRIVYPCLAVACAAAGSYLAIGVISHEFYFRASSPLRFGVGYSRLEVPLAACDWINVNKPAGRLWTDYNSSSNVYYFTRPHVDVPVMTNTWAFPPSVMGEVLAVDHGRQPFDAGRPGAPDPVAGRYNIQTVVLRAGAPTWELVRHLISSPQWSLVYLDSVNVIFLRNDGPNRDLAMSAKLTPQAFDSRKFISQIGRVDPRPEQAMVLGAMTLGNLGWTDHAIEVLHAAVKQRPDFAGANNLLGIALAQRGTIRLTRGRIDDGRTDLLDAEQAFEKALAMPNAQQNLQLVRQQLAALEKGVILTPQMK